MTLLPLGLATLIVGLLLLAIVWGLARGDHETAVDFLLPVTLWVAGAGAP